MNAAAMSTWREVLSKSETERAKGAKFTKHAGVLLWQGAQAAVEAWMPESDTDVSAEGLYTEVMDALGGKHRKGDASKIKSVALAVKNHGLVLALYPNLAKAYAEAKRLTTTVQQEKAEDAAADAAVEALAKEAPNTASTPENAAKIVLSKGLDEAARLLLDALGATNEAAHRALLRALSQEIAGRVQPKVKTTSSGPKAGAKQAGSAGTKPKAQVRTAGTKPKAGKVETGKAAPVQKATAAPTKAKPIKKAAPVAAKAKPAPASPEQEAEVIQHPKAEAVSTPAVGVKRAVPQPVRRPVVKRA